MKTPTKLTMIAMTLLAMATSAQALQIASEDIKAGKTIGNDFIYNGMSCTGKNQSPELHWKDAPKDTKSFALTVYDPDAPTGSGFWHWVVYNLPTTTTSLSKGWNADGKNGTAAISDFGTSQYGGPCPPPGKPHHYIFTVHALKTEKIDLPPGATNAFARFMIEGATIQKANVTATYGR